MSLIASFSLVRLFHGIKLPPNFNLYIPTNLSIYTLNFLLFSEFCHIFTVVFDWIPLWPRRENFRLDINVSIYLLILLFAIMVHNEALNEDAAKSIEG